MLVIFRIAIVKSKLLRSGIAQYSSEQYSAETCRTEAPLAMYKCDVIRAPSLPGSKNLDRKLRARVALQRYVA